MTGRFIESVQILVTVRMLLLRMDDALSGYRTEPSPQGKIGKVLADRLPEPVADVLDGCPTGLGAGIPGYGSAWSWRRNRSGAVGAGCAARCTAADLPPQR